jgi:hypothetical protein
MQLILLHETFVVEEFASSDRTSLRCSVTLNVDVRPPTGTSPLGVSNRTVNTCELRVELGSSAVSAPPTAAYGFPAHITV